MKLTELLEIHKGKILAGHDVFLVDGDGHHSILYRANVSSEQRIAIQYEEGFTFCVFPEHPSFEVVDIQLAHPQNRTLLAEHLKWPVEETK